MADPQANEFQRFGRKMDDKLKDAMPKIEAEVQRMVRYMNDELVPEARREGGNALRAAAEQLRKLADYMETHVGKKNGE